MEVAGLALGGIPIILYALDNYQRCLQPAKNFWKYESTLKTIRMNVFIQQEQLETTLRNIGLIKPSADELRAHLKSAYPLKAEEFINILSHMDKLVERLMSNLDIDSRGKPQWTAESPERAIWEWRRVKRSFGHREREAIITELSYWNNALRSVFEKPEIPSDESDPLVEELQAQFQLKHCDTIREHAQLLHATLSGSSAWGCHCGEHQGSLSLRWHLQKSLAPSTISLGLKTGDEWRALRVEIETEQDIIAQSSTSSISTTTSRPPSPSRREKLKQFFKYSRKKSSPGLLAPDMVQEMKEATPEKEAQISCLCAFAHYPPGQGCGILDVPFVNSDGVRQRILVKTVATNAGRMVLTDLVSILEAGRKPGMAHHSSLSRKDRLAIGAAATWAALYLCGSPWIPEVWGGKSEIKLFVPDTNHQASRLGITRSEPAVSCFFAPEAGSHTSTSAQEPISKSERFQSGQIRNKTLFALGILLIELCLNTTFEQLRLETSGYSMPSTSIESTLPDDFDIANRLADKVYLEAGYSYGYAVQRCLRCEFPGRDVTKTFEFSQFRRSFFNGVVAPVQATFVAQPVSGLVM